MPCSCEFCVCDRQSLGNVTAGCDCERCVRYRDTFTSCLISMAVVHKDRKQFVSVDEGREGWYLPAGRVDAGETFATGARREAIEEAGCDIELTGLLWFENSADSMSCRFRAVYEAKVKDPKAPLKSIPDKESKGAAWVTVADLSKRPLRSTEVQRLFDAVAKGYKGAPLEILTGSDGKAVDNNRVLTRLALFAKLLVVDDKGRLLLKKEAKEDVEAVEAKEQKQQESADNAATTTTTTTTTTTKAYSYSLPCARVRGNRPLPLARFAPSVLSSVAGRECPVELQSLAGIWHHAPIEIGQVGELGMAFVATLKLSSSSSKPSTSAATSAVTASTVSSASLSEEEWGRLGLCWVSAEQDPAALSEQDAALWTRVKAKQVAPLSVVAS